MNAIAKRILLCEEHDRLNKRVESLITRGLDWTRACKEAEQRLDLVEGELTAIFSA
jgi:hypothetical protein